MRLWLDTAWTAFLDFGVYLFCVAGVLASQYLDAFTAQQRIDLSTLSMARVGLAMLIAFALIARDEWGADRKGRRSNWLRRAQFALGQGFMWQTIMGAM